MMRWPGCGRRPLAGRWLGCFGRSSGKARARASQTWTGTRCPCVRSWGIIDEETCQEGLRRYAGRVGSPVEISVQRASDDEIAVLIATTKGSKWIIRLTVEADPPHRMLTVQTDRKHDFKLDVREATAGGRADPFRH